MKVTRQSKLNLSIQHILFIALLSGCIGFAGWLSNEYNLRSDWTKGKRHSLSTDTIQLLSQLKTPVRLRSYQPDDESLTQAITEILHRYKNHKSDFDFEIINPDIFIVRAKQDNIERYGQTIIEYQGQSERIDTLSEENISNALIRLHRGKKPQVLFVTQHGERNINDRSATGYSLLVDKLSNKGFVASNVNLLQQTISTANTVLILGTIKNPLLDSELNKIKQFINSGGNLLWLQDPAPDPSQLALSEILEISFIKGVVVDNNQEVSRMLQLSHPAIIPILEYKLHPITEKMQYYTLFTTASGIRAQTSSLSRDKSENKPSTPGNPWIHSELLISSDSSWSETGDFIPGVAFDPDQDTSGPLSIGLAQQRQIISDKQMTSQRVVVIGDSDFIANSNLGHGANLDFILKTLNWLSNDDKLISIAPKNAPDLKLKLSSTSASIIGIMFLFALPIALFTCGGVIWLKRRNR